jgi:hypothetical protein
MIRSLDEAAGAREPLIDIVEKFKGGVDYDLATRAVNSLGQDIELYAGHWYGSHQLRIGQVTAEGALRLFIVCFRRVPLERSNSQSFRWSSTEIVRWPASIAPYVESIGITQPGANDDGQPYVPLFER